MMRFFPQSFAVLQAPPPLCEDSERVDGCSSCGASMCPPMSWQDCGQRFYCPFCGKLNEGEIRIRNLLLKDILPTHRFLTRRFFLLPQWRGNTTSPPQE